MLTLMHYASRISPSSPHVRSVQAVLNQIMQGTESISKTRHFLLVFGAILLK